MWQSRNLEKENQSSISIHATAELTFIAWLMGEFMTIDSEIYFTMSKLHSKLISILKDFHMAVILFPTNIALVFIKLH